MCISRFFFFFFNAWNWIVLFLEEILLGFFKCISTKKKRYLDNFMLQMRINVEEDA